MDKKQIIFHRVILCLIIIFSSLFVSVMGYINFKSNYKEIKDQIYQEISNETIFTIENALDFGKTLENYYGMNEIFENLKEKIGNGIEIFILDENQKILYYSFDESKISEFENALSSIDFKKIIEKVDINTASENASVDNKNFVIQLIKKDNKVIGKFILTYNDELVNEQLKDIKLEITKNTILVIVITLIIFIIGDIIIFKMVHKLNRHIVNVFPIILIVFAIFIESILSIYIYKDNYKDNMFDGAKSILTNLNETISNVSDKGIELDEISGLEDYLREKVSNTPILWNLKISDEIVNVANSTGRENELLLTYDLNNQALKLEAELSNDYINNKIFEMILLMASTLIILIIFVIEIMKLPNLLMYKISENNNKETDESYIQVSNSLRFTAFLCSTAEYMCVPYAAMIIRDLNVSVFGLSVGMTAALPLSLEGFTQMIAMLIFPKYVKKLNIKNTLIFSSILMILCNLFAFSSKTAIGIIICRAVAGIAYAGFKQISNYIITRGYKTEVQRSVNLSQDNAGLLGGVTCGAGLGAIISSTAGYSISFFISAIVFLIYLVVTIYIVPWNWLKTKISDEKEKQKVNVKKIIKMIFSFEMIRYIILIGIPLNVAVQLCVTLIPGICQNNGISTIVLSYCYIANGIAGIYIGPAIVNLGKKYLGLNISISLTFLLTAISIVVLELPFLAVMMIISSMILGFTDGFGTPLCMDKFMELKIIKNTVDESTALIFCVVLSYVLVTFAPMIAELMLIETKGILNPIIIGTFIYIIVSFILILIKQKNKSYG